MTGKARLPSAADGKAIRQQAERALSAREAAAYLGAPVTPEEEAEALSLIAWFRRRYPGPAGRLAYARRAYRRWTAARLRTTHED